MEKEEASKIIAEKLEYAYALINECVKISNESGVWFTLPWGGEGTEEAGMGASYHPINDGYHENGWNPSAHSC